ncbi:hypothetical protein ACXX83_10105 [Pseudomonas sp. GNP012]
MSGESALNIDPVGQQGYQAGGACDWTGRGTSQHEIKDGHLVTTLGGTPFEATVFEQNGKYVAARSNEFGYVNYEVEAVK